MINLAILTPFHERYKALVTNMLAQDICLAWSGEDASLALPFEKIDILLASPKLVAQHLEKFTHLKWMQSTWAGNTPLLQHHKQDYLLTGLKDIFGPLMSEYVFAYILFFQRQLPFFEEQKRRRDWNQPNLGTLKHKTLCLLGTGSIGKHLSKTAKHFGMRVLGVSRTAKETENIDKNYAVEQLAIPLSQADFVVNSLPDTPQTYHILNQQTLQVLQPHCVLINVGRGNAIDTESLVAMLTHKKLKAAVLDVFDQEPLDQNSPLYHLENVIITNHTAATSYPEDVMPVFIDNLQRFKNNQPLRFVMDFNQGY